MSARAFSIAVLLIVTGLQPVLAQPGNGNGNGNGNGRGPGSPRAEDARQNGPAEGGGQGNGAGQGNSGGGDEVSPDRPANPELGGDRPAVQGPGNSSAGNDDADATPGAGSMPGEPALTLSPELPTQSARPAGLGPDEVAGAVRSGEAAPLATIIQSLTQGTTDRVVEAELLRLNGLLVYALKTVSSDGEIQTQYVDARSGRLLVVR